MKQGQLKRDYLYSQTPMGKDEYKRLSQIIQQLMDSPDSGEFRQPVDVKRLGLNDYFDIVRQPMDLGTVSRNLQQSKYKIVEECLDDIQLIWDNCKVYNAYGSVQVDMEIGRQIREIIQKIRKKLFTPSEPTLAKEGVNKVQRQRDKQVRIQLVMNIINISNIFTEEQNEVISYNDKMEFSNNLKLLQPDQIGLIVHMIQNDCPNAFVEVDKERYQIIVDNIDTDIFFKCIKQVEMWIIGEEGTKKIKL